MKVIFTDNEKQVLFSRLRKLALPLDPKEVDWFWSTDMSLIHGNLGRYYCIQDEIVIAEDSRTLALSQNDMLPSMCHELYHAYQRRKYGLPLYSLLNFRLWSRFTLERNARKEELRVRNLLGLSSVETGEED